MAKEQSPESRIEPRTSGAHSLAHSLRGLIRDQERHLVVAALRSSHWNISETARQLGMTRAGLYKAIYRLQVRIERA